ncbi:class II aldolase/adducin family protein [Nocardia sp. NPDC058058]|uniref:class II aldolase/adducin family protein n=1 Tax=Nocardia sp. NPDC058058 TaxID=3346317 RepID=UPI0036DE8FBE
MQHQAEREEIVDAVADLFACGVIPPSRQATFSVRLPDGDILITSGESSHGSPAAQFGLLAADGTLKDGSSSALSASMIPIHLAIFAAQPGFDAIAHTYPPFTTAFAVADRPLVSRYEPLLRAGQRNEISVVPWSPEGGDTAESIRKIVASEPGNRATLLANNGIIAYHSTLHELVQLLIAIEESAALELRAAQLGGVR